MASKTCSFCCSAVWEFTLQVLDLRTWETVRTFYDVRKAHAELKAYRDAGVIARLQKRWIDV